MDHDVSREPMRGWDPFGYSFTTTAKLLPIETASLIYISECFVRRIQMENCVLYTKRTFGGRTQSYTNRPGRSCTYRGFLGITPIDHVSRKATDILETFCHMSAE